ncbi:MarC family protein [Marinagarivorans algicola]|uniref:MarC family protein n=1 Tax=Marinagarivorans algicola TaxID=1513270 RepID=UPI0006B4223B|nr:MarC family protein [Marinagarivorans algicola]
MPELYFTIAIKFVFLFAPFFVVTMFLALTRGETIAVKRHTALRAISASATISVVLFFAGPILFEAIGITLDSFRIGAGSLLFLTAVSLVNSGTRNHAKGLPDEERDDIAVVPLAMPVIVGPATIGTILVLGAELPTFTETFVGMLGMLSALIVVGAMLLLSGMLERALGKTGLNILSKVSGLILAAMAAEIVFTGVVGFLNK